MHLNFTQPHHRKPYLMVQGSTVMFILMDQTMEGKLQVNMNTFLVMSSDHVTKHYELTTNSDLVSSSQSTWVTLCIGGTAMFSRLH